jgi:hypothetical protein
MSPDEPGGRAGSVDRVTGEHFPRVHRESVLP